MSTRRCEECGALLDPAKILRCTKCKACFYCSAACQKRNWRIHKRVCTTDPLLRRFVPVEMAVERSLLKQSKVQKAPKEAFCYICLDGDGASSKLMRGCACRGDSAGFVHLECLTELALSKEASGDKRAAYDAWTKCGNCKQIFTGALELEMARRFWRRYRSSHDVEQRYHSTRSLASSLGLDGEVDAANQLFHAASTCIGNNTEALLDLKLRRTSMLSTNGQKVEALGLLQAMLPEAKVYTARPQLYSFTMMQIAEVLVVLDRYQEAHEAVAEAVAFCKAKFGLEHPWTLHAMKTYAITCEKLGRVEEAKANLKTVLTIETRVFGRDHPQTQFTWEKMRSYGFSEPSG